MFLSWGVGGIIIFIFFDILKCFSEGFFVYFILKLNMFNDGVGGVIFLLLVMLFFFVFLFCWMLGFFVVVKFIDWYFMFILKRLMVGFLLFVFVLLMLMENLFCRFVIL